MALALHIVPAADVLPMYGELDTRYVPVCMPPTPRR